MGESNVVFGAVKEVRDQYHMFTGHKVVGSHQRHHNLLEEALFGFENEKVIIPITKVYTESKSGLLEIVKESKSATTWWYNRVWLPRYRQKHPLKRAAKFIIPPPRLIMMNV